jgi:pyruvate carboxylase
MEKNREIVITIDDVDYPTFSTPAYDKKTKWTQPDERYIAAIIPGTIVKIFVKIGDKIKAGDNMLVIEAMKMNNQITFDKDGVVDQILVSEGSIIAKGQILIVLK